MGYKDEFIRALNERGIKYSDIDENSVDIRYNGVNTNRIEIAVIFDDDDERTVALRCWSFGKVPQEDKRPALFEACNRVNNDFRWAKFFINEEDEVVAAIDAVVEIGTVGEECISLVGRLVRIYDNAYPILMKACWA